jgi:hypothetical protein
MKCGGTTLNCWLDTLTSDERAFREEAWQRFAVVEKPPDGMGRASRMVIPSLASTLFHWSDVVHHHGPLRMYSPANTFCVTVLRDPVQRLISQVSDWRRLTDSDTARSSAAERACLEDSRRLPLRDFLRMHGQQFGRKFLDNHMTRALAAGRGGNPVSNVMDAASLCEVALQSLENDYDLIGLTEELDLSRNALCAMVGLPPARKIPLLNATCKEGRPNPELLGRDDILHRLTRVDRVIYDRARSLFDRRHRQAAETYDIESFETKHASRLLGEARGRHCDGATRYSVRAPIVGSGFHGRDGSGTPSCSVWSGPETRTTLYLPVPAGMKLSLLVWIRGYADSRQRDQIRVRVDGSPIAHHFAAADDYADVLTVETFSTRDFVRLEIDLDETLASGDPGSARHDARKRGFAFDSYGWRPI